jgi:hypothetical protein
MSLYQDFTQSIRDNTSIWNAGDLLNPASALGTISRVAVGTEKNRRNRRNGGFNPNQEVQAAQSDYDALYRSVRAGQGSMDQLQNFYQTNKNLGIEVDTRGASFENVNSGNNQQQAQANALLDQAAGINTDRYSQEIDNIVNPQSGATQAPGVVDMNLRNEAFDDLLRTAGLQAKLNMQNAVFQSDLNFNNAVRSRGLHRDVKHQENDALIANTKAAAMPNILSALASQANNQNDNWSNFYGQMFR